MIIGGKYVNPVWNNDGNPALDADELNAMSSTLQTHDSKAGNWDKAYNNWANGYADASGLAKIIFVPEENSVEGSQTVKKTRIAIKKTTADVNTDVIKATMVHSVYDGDETKSTTSFGIVDENNKTAIQLTAMSDAEAEAMNGLKRALRFTYNDKSQMTISLDNNEHSAFRMRNPYTTSSSANVNLSLVSGETDYYYLALVSSSRKFKKNIEELPEGLIDKMRAVYYESTLEGDNGRHIGFIAEEMAEAVPELVEYDANGEPRSVNYDRVAAVCVKEIQALKAEIKELKKEIEGLKGK